MKLIINRSVISIFGKILLILFAVYIFSIPTCNDIRRNRNPKYTIGTIIEINYGVEGVPDVHVQFEVSGKEYKFWYPFEGLHKDLKTGKIFLIKYDELNPKNAKVLFDYNVNSDTPFPIDGWDSIPRNL